MSSWFVPDGAEFSGSDGTQGPPPFDESPFDESLLPPLLGGGGVGPEVMTGWPLMIRTLCAETPQGVASNSAHIKYRTRRLMFSGFIGSFAWFW